MFKIYKDKEFIELFTKSRSESESDFGDITITNLVRDIILDIKNNGDSAILKYNQKFDNNQKKSFTIDKSIMKEIFKKTPEELKQALYYAKTRIEEYHTKQLHRHLLDYTDNDISFYEKLIPIEKAGIYVPGGTASYPSSVLMNVIPAQIAGVKDISITTPAINGEISDAIITACVICGIDKICTIGGVQAIAALAFGTESVSKVNKIAGPGNQYVTEAKRQLYGIVGIDSLAGPSDITIIADSSSNVDFVVADLMAQSEHGTTSKSILITDSHEFANNVIKKLDELLSKLSRKDIIKEAIKNNGKIIICDDIRDSYIISNIIAPEHLQISTRYNEEIADKITNAGAVFIGNYCCEILGDYVLGASHTLPTSSSAKFDSGLSVYSFLKTVRFSSINNISDHYNIMAGYASKIAEHEKLDAHKLAIDLRRK